jgi:hypothetical protein
LQAEGISHSTLMKIVSLPIQVPQQEHFSLVHFIKVIFRLVVCEMVQITTCSRRDLAQALQTPSSPRATVNALKLSAVLAISGNRHIKIVL